MATDLHVNVIFGNGQLTIAEGNKDLMLTDATPAIHSVVWSFEGIEELASKFHPGLEIVSSSSSPEPETRLYSGPFISLCQTPNSVIACGNNGIPGSYAYHAVLKDAINGEIIKSVNHSVLTNEVTLERPAHVKVHHVPETQELVVEQQTVSLVRGQSILWEVVEPLVEVPAWYPRLVFQEGNSFFGPFGSLSTRDRSILGTGSGGEPGSYDYRFQMVSVEDGQVLFESSPDPVVDDEGDPSGNPSPEVTTS